MRGKAKLQFIEDCAPFDPPITYFNEALMIDRNALITDLVDALEESDCPYKSPGAPICIDGKLHEDQAVFDCDWHAKRTALIERAKGVVGE